MRRQPYTNRELENTPCVKCGAPSKHQWRICCKRTWTPVCDNCDLEINAIVAVWAFGQEKATTLLERYCGER